MSGCVKDLAIVIKSSFTCPENFVGSLSAASPRSTVREIIRSQNPFYCYRDSIDMVVGDYAKVDVGDPGLTGALDAFLYVLINGEATAGTNTTLTDMTKNWPVNALAGMLIVFVSGTGSGGSSTIASNTATQITFTAPYAPGVDNTTHYSIRVDEDDDSGPGSNAEIEFTATFADTYTFEGTTYARNITGGFEVDFVCVSAAIGSSPYCPTSDPTLPATIDFTDQSVGNPDAWDWDFGDGSAHSHLQNPSHTYTATDYTPRDPGTIGNHCGSVHVVLIASKGSSSSTANFYMSLKPVVRIKNYVDGFFTKSVDISRAHHLDSCTDTVIPAWDGVLYPVCPALFCQWRATGVNVFGKLVDVFLMRNAPDTWGVCMPNGMFDEGYHLAIGCTGNPNVESGYLIYYLRTSSNQPLGVYTLYWAPDFLPIVDPCGWGNDIQDPHTLEIEYVP